MSLVSDRNSITREYSDFKLHIGAPIMIMHGATWDELRWGPIQFPSLHFTNAGSIRCSWGVHTDKIDGGTAFNIPSSAVSDDGGLTWRETTANDKVSFKSRSLMSNGKYFAGFVGKNGYVIDGLDERYTPVMGPTYENKKLFLPSDLVAGGDLDLTYRAQEYDPQTGEVTTFDCTINWPNQLISAYYGKGYTDNTIHPPQRELGLGNGLGDIAIGDKLYYCTYARGLDPKTGKISKYSQYFSTFVFCSEDNARTWNVIAQINVNDEVIEESQNHPGHFEGFGEVKMDLMPDGTVALLVRTGSNQPCYLMRSTDNCKTWSKPVKFDEVGVRPFIMALGCGVSLATYGRDGLFVRATSDPSGAEWQEHIEIPFGEIGKIKSCYYTYMLPLDENRALFVYSDFHYSPTGEECDVGKSMIGRIITVEKK